MILICGGTCEWQSEQERLRDGYGCSRFGGRRCAALVLGSGVAAVANEAALLADQVLVADRAELAQYDAEVWSAAVAQIASEGEAEAVLIAAAAAGASIVRALR